MDGEIMRFLEGVGRMDTHTHASSAFATNFNFTRVCVTQSGEDIERRERQALELVPRNVAS